jgi:hypothetical protein
MTAMPSCPYCNAALSVTDVVCPVCGERLPGRSGPVAAPTPVAPSNRRVALIVVAVMVTCATAALAYALWTQAVRRANDQGSPPKPPRSPFDTPAGPVAPEQLTALRYLPAGLDLLVGVHFATLYDEPATRALLEQPLPVGKTQFRLTDLPTWTGLEASALDHAVLGLALPEAGFPRVVLVLRTRRDFEVDAVKVALHAKVVENAGRNEQRKLWEVKLGNAELPATLWIADDRTLVLGLIPADFTELPAPNTEKLAHLSGTLQTRLRQRIDPGAVVWVAGQLRHGLRGVASIGANGVLARLNLKPEQKTAIEEMRSFAGGVVPGPEIACRLNVELGEARAADTVAGIVRGPRPNPRVEVEGAWVTVQWKTTLAELAQALGR